MKQYTMTLFNLETKEIVLSEVRNELELTGTDYEHVINELQEYQSFVELGYKEKDGVDFDYKWLLTRVV